MLATERQCRRAAGLVDQRVRRRAQNPESSSPQALSSLCYSTPVKRPLFALLSLLACRSANVSAPPDAGPALQGPQLRTVGPRTLSSQTSQPLTIVGERLVPGLALHLGAPANVDLPLTVLDATHAWARVPSLPFTATQGSEVLVDATLSTGAGTARLRFANDTTFPDLVAFVLSPDGTMGYVASSTTDTVFAVDLRTHAVTALPVGDGPSALATWVDASGAAWLVVAHQFAPELRLLPLKDPTQFKTLPAPAYASGLLVSKAGVAFVAEQARDTVSALSLADGAKELWRTPVAPNPKALALTDAALFVGSLQTGTVERLDPRTGVPSALFEPGPGTPIIGGGTAGFSKYVMNGKAPRALLASAKLGRVFVSSIGPNVGPNPDKLEVSMNGGVGVVDPARGWLRHLGFGAGVTDALALDDARGLLYAADVGLGLVRVVDAKKLAQGDTAAATALLQELALPAPIDFPLIRPLGDFTVKNRAGPSLHSGPRALALSADGKTLWVLNRFTGTLARLDVTRAAQAKAEWKEQLPITPMLAQRTRRLGQVLYFADLGRTAMSCDACHLEGHGEGVLFEKTQPLRIYRSTTVRGSRETPPYFTPASTHSMGETMKMVGGRNRFHNPDPTAEEVEALTAYGGLLTTLPNPFVGADGAPVETLTLPDGQVGHPRAGLALFEGKAACAGCHPSPQFTTDQDVATRGRFLDVGTPRFMPLREAMQDTRFEGFGTPALVGAWDVFPMLTTGLAGLAPQDDGRVTVVDRFCLKVAVERWAPTHGRADLLSAGERNDLLAYVLSL
jgi:DNA-binding beta-propeller fold protein YncE